jgi:hypothetical protein
MFRLHIYFLLAAAILSSSGVIRSAHSQPVPADDHYTARIESIFNSRCIACHSCYNAPCQLNLQSYSGFARGATKLNVYDRSRPMSVAPTRLDIDGHSVSDWRAKGFSVWRAAPIRPANDAINSARLADDPVRSGSLDLTRYALQVR